MTQTHHLRRLSLQVDVADAATALALRTRIEEMVQALLPPVLERVMQRLAPGDTLVEIGRLSINLGRFHPDRLAEEVPPALERALVDALSRHLAPDPPPDQPAPRRLSPDQAALALLDSWLTSGMLPAWGRSRGFDGATLLAGLVESQPRAVAALLLQRGRERRVLERLVLQVDPAGLGRLLSLLAPADAAIVRAWLVDLLLLHRDAPLMARSDPAVERLFWLLTLEYLVQEAGSQFNRRSFLRRLLQGFADAEGLDYASLLLLLGRGAARIARQRPLGSSLPALLRDLLAAEGGADAAALIDTPIPQGAASGGPVDEVVLLALLRQAARDPALLALFAARLTVRRFERLVRRMEPVHAAPILDFLADLTRLQRDEPVADLSDDGFARLLRLLTLADLSRDHGTGFNRRSFARRVLRGLAEAEDIPWSRLLALLRRALERQAARGGLPPALPGLLGDVLAAEGGEGADRVPPPAAVPTALPAPPGWDATAGLLPVAGRLALLVQRLPEIGFTQLVRQLAPDRATPVLTCLDGLARLHRQEALVPLSQDRFVRLLRQLTLAHLLRQPGSHFNRRSWLRRLLEDLAAAERIAYGDLLTALAAAVLRTSQRPFQADTLPALIHELAIDQGLEGQGLDGDLAEASLSPARLHRLGRLDARAWHRRLTRLAPALADDLRTLLDLLGEALVRLGHGGTAASGRLRASLLDWLRQTPAGQWSLSAAARHLLAQGVDLPPGQRDALLVLAHRLAGAAGQGKLANSLPPAPAPARVGPRPPDPRHPMFQEIALENLYVENAGLVLAGPFLPHLFSTLGFLLPADGAGDAPRIDPDQASRAVHLLQFLVDGRCGVPEPELVLNKLLCGLSPQTPIEAAITPTEAETGLCLQLLQAMLANWPILSNTSVAGLRETFLQRTGRLEMRPDGPTLTVQRKTVDVLVDQVPWGFRMIYHAWMRQPVHVIW